MYMRKISLLFILPLVFTQLISAQDDSGDDKNVVISQSRREFKFVKGNDVNPVQIKEESKTVYTCTNYRTSIPVAEFYNDVETIDDVSILVDGSKKHGIRPQYEYYSADGIFFSDQHICYFQLPLEKKGSESEVRFEKTTLDPRYFTNIFFSEHLAINDQEVKIVVPSWMQIEIKEYNFSKYNVQKKVSTDNGETTYVFSMKNIPSSKKEESSPGPTYFLPHILIMCKSAQPKEVKYTYFKTLAEQYAWYSSLIEKNGEEEKTVREKAEELTSGLATDEDKVKAIFLWVQNNVRYIAFEDGIAGFRPEKSQEVLRKKYGDCKGMANLLTVMLRSIKLDARRSWIGTRHIAYDYSTPSLAVDNHMICAWMKKGKPVFLDATEKYIGYGEVAERIQGRQTLIENGNQYLLEKVPLATYLQNTAIESRTFTMNGANLKGHVVQKWKGENKEWLLASLNDIKTDKQENALKQYLGRGKQNFEISNFKMTNINDYNTDLKVEYDVVWKDILTVFDKEIYIEADNRRSFENFKIDTAKRKTPYWFDFKNHLIFETEIELGNGKVATTIPEKLQIKQPGYNFTASYSVVPGKIIYKSEIIINDTELPVEKFGQWNRDIEALVNFYNQQLVLTQKN